MIIKNEQLKREYIYIIQMNNYFSSFIFPFLILLFYHRDQTVSYLHIHGIFISLLFFFSSVCDKMFKMIIKRKQKFVLLLKL